MKRFRSEIFDLCKILQSRDEFSSLRNTMASLRFASSEGVIDLKSNVCANGINLRAEFYGLLIAFQHGLSSFPNVEAEKIALTEKEFNSIAYGHSYISRFLEMCLSDVICQNETIGQLLSPYSFFLPVSNIPDFDIDASIFDKAVNSFKKSAVYCSLINSNALTALKQVSEEALRNLFGLMYKDILYKPVDSVSNEILSLKVREQSFKPNQQISPVDALQLISFKLLALREMLSAAASLIYDAILGSDLVVIDENSLINIEKSSSNVAYSYKTVLIQGGILCPFNDVLNIVFLLHIDNEKTKIHDFGRAKSYTFSFANENGDTTKLSFYVLDEDLNPIANLTN